MAMAKNPTDVVTGNDEEVQAGTTVPSSADSSATDGGQEASTPTTSVEQTAAADERHAQVATTTTNEAPKTKPAKKQEAQQSRWSTRQLVTMALLCAIAILLSFVEFPIFPAASWLKYDASYVAIMIVGFAYGPGAGITVGLVAWLIHGLMVGDVFGIMMSVLVMIGYVLPASLIYKYHRTFKGAIVGLIVGVVVSIIFAIIGNLIITPWYNGMPVESVVAMILPILLPFNALKAVLSSLLTVVVYKAVKNLITPKKEQVVGR